MTESKTTSASPSLAEREAIARERLTKMVEQDQGQPDKKAIEIAARLMAKRDARKAKSS